MRMRIAVARLSLGASLGALVALSSGNARASSHREAPFVTKNPKVDATDFYMFRSYQTGRDGFVTIIANYLPLQDGYGGPNFFQMDPDALYEIHIDNNGDAKEDITFQFQFSNTLANSGTGLTLPIGNADAGVKNVPVSFFNLGPLDGPNGSAANLNVSETYTVKYVAGDRRTGTATELQHGGSATFTKPSDYIGSKSLGTPATYEAYARNGIYSVNLPGCNTPANVFVGQRHESFSVNLGVIFDLVNAPVNVVAGGSATASTGGPGTIDDKNVTTIALEVPTACLTTNNQPIVGGWTTASVRQARVINPSATYTRPSREGGAWAQVSRLGMPLVNEVVIGVKDKDRFNSSQPKDDGQFADYVTHPTLPKILEILFSAAAPTAQAPKAFPRADLVSVFLTGVQSQDATSNTDFNINKNGAVAEYVRLNTALPIRKTVAQGDAKGQVSLGAAGCFLGGKLTTGAATCDPAGFPNGRRPGDDVTDIALRVVMGYLFGDDNVAPARGIPFTDAAIQNETQFDTVFPYLRTPNPGAT